MANNITLTGRLTANAELKTTPNGVSVCSFTLAVKRPRTKDVTDFIPCQVWRQGAEYLSKYGSKGNMAAVTGALTSRKWQDKDGNSRVSYEVTCDTVELLESRQNGEGGTNTADTSNVPQSATESGKEGFVELGENDDLPF